jgi:ABC-type oligopeptide transport system ATPase subunit
MTLLEVEGLVKVFKPRRGLRHGEATRAVDDVSFTLERGRTLGLVGESGAGKSTTGLLVTRLLDADAGVIRLNGTDVMALGTEALRRFRRHMQVIFQDPHSSLDPRVTIGTSVAEPMRVLLGTNRVDAEQRAVTLLQRVALGAHIAGRLPRELSGGQLQRVAIARALTVDPSLVVCDEPVSALDVSVRAEVLNLLRELQDERGLAYLFVSHDLSIVKAVADEVALMSEGRIVERGSTTTIFANPRTDFARDLLDAIPIPDPRSRNLIRTSPTPAPTSDRISSGRE